MEFKEVQNSKNDSVEYRIPNQQYFFSIREMRRKVFNYEISIYIHQITRQ